VSAGGVVFRRTLAGPQFVLIKANGRWGFPKGNIEKDETPELAALREISEETGLPTNRLLIVSHLSEIEEAQWFTPADARRVISFKGSRGTLDAAIAGVEAGQVAS
jgi:predicted NUDIX family NTP pyrophosphohydrolase